MTGPIQRGLVLAGSLSIPIYLLIALLSFQFRHGEGHRDRPILLVLGLLAAAWCVYAATLSSILFRRPRRDDPGASREEPRPPRLKTIFFFAVVFRLVLLASNPIQEIDYYRYLWDGRVLLAGMNPFARAPAQIDRGGPVSAAESRLGRLWTLSHRSETVRVIFERVHHREVPTIYPPAAQLVFAGSVLATPADSPVWVHVLVLKIILVGFDLGTLVVLARLLQRVGRPAELCLAYGWCPLVIKEFANSGHLDSIAVFFTTLGAYWLVGVPDRRTAAAARPTGPGAKCATAALGIAILSKHYPLVFIPVIIAYLAGRRRAAAATIVLVAVVAAGYAPFVVTAPSRNHTPWTGLGTFLSRWQKNDFLFMIVHENLRAPIAGVADYGFVVVSPAARRSLARRWFEPWFGTLPAPGVDPAFVATQVMMGSLVAGISLFWAWRVFREPTAALLLQGVGSVLAWGWLLSGAPHPWYLIWSLPFLVFVPRRSWFLMTGLVFFYYLRFWFEYQASPLGLEAVEGSLDRFDHELVWFEYAPFFAAMIAETAWQGWLGTKTRR